MVGRVREVDALTALLDDASVGRGRLALVAGEPGAGKTRLIEELADRAEDRGLRTVWATGSPSAGMPPLWLWTQALRSLADTGRVVDPRLLEVLTDGGQSRGLLGAIDPAGARFRLFDRTMSCLGRAAGEQPTFLALDDLHAADRSSLQLLQLLTTTVRSVPLVILGAYRDVEVLVGDPLNDFLIELPRDIERVSLSGLDRGEVAALAAATAGVPLDGSLADSLHDRTAGNPFFVKELVRLLLAQGQLDEPGPMPASVCEVLDRRLARLSPRCNEVLSVAAVIGRDLSAGLLAEVVGVGPDELSDLLDEAVAARIVTETELDRCGFVHDLFRQVIYDGLGRSRRLRLHAAVGEAIEARSSDIDVHLDELAHHFLAAIPFGDARRAVGYAARAGAHANRLLACDEAVGHYQRALAALPAGHGGKERPELLLTLGEARWRATDIAGARSALGDVAAAARSLGDGELFARAALAYACGPGGNQAPTVHADRALIALLEEALDRLDPADGGLRCRVQSRLAVELYLTDQLERRTLLSKQARAMARRLADPAALATALHAGQLAMFGPDGLADRIAAADEIIELAAEADDDELALWGRLFRVWTLLERCQRVDDELADCGRIAERLRMPGYQAEVAFRTAVLAVLAGRRDECDRMLAKATATNDPGTQATLHSLLTLVGYVYGPLDDLETTVRALAREHPDTTMWRAALICLLVELGSLDQARVEFEALAGSGFDLPRGGLWLTAMHMLALGCFAVGDPARAEILHQRLLPYVDQGSIGAFGSVATSVGLLDAARERFDDALRWLDLGYERNIASGNDAFALWTLRERAAVLRARRRSDDLAAATDLLERVAGELGRRGLNGFLVRTESLLAAVREPGAKLRRDGEFWLVTYGGVTVPLAPSKGVADLAVLLAAPGREVHAIDLVGAIRATDTGEVLDMRALREYRARLTELARDIADAEATADVARAEAARLEREAVTRELSTALGLGGRTRRTGDVAERARKAVIWRIRHAIKAVSTAHSALGRHLDRSIRTGTFSSYQPERPIVWRVG